MATEDLQIHLQARDDLTRELKNTIKTVAKLEQALRDATDGTSDATERDIEKLSRKLETAQSKTKSLSGAVDGLDRNIDQLGGSADRAGDKIDRMSDSGARTRKGFGALIGAGKGAAVAITAVATASVVAAVGLKRATDAAIGMEAKLRRTETVFGKQTRMVRRWARAHDEAFGASSTDVASYLTSIADILKPLGFTTKEATKLSMGVGDLIPALTEWNTKGMDAAQVTDALTAALTGEREMLKSLGIVISEEDVKAKVESMKASGELTTQSEKQAKSMATLALATEGSADALKAQNDGQETAGRRMNRMKTQIGNLRDGGFAVLLSAWDRIDKAFGESDLGSPVKSLAKFVRQNKDQIVSFILRVASGFAKWLSVWLKFESAVVAGAGYVVGAFAQLLRVMSFVDPEMKGAADRASELAIQMGNVAKEMGDASTKADKTSDSLNDQADAASNAQGRLDAMRESLKGLTKEQKKQARATFNNTSSAIPSYIVPGNAGDTTTPMGVGPGLGAAGLAAAHAAFSGGVNGHHITSGIRGWGLGSARSDHLRGRAMDVKGPHLGSYANAVRAAGGYAALHGSGASRHLHVVPRTHRPQPVMAGGDTLHAEVHLHGGNIRPFDARQAVISGLREAERSKRQRGGR